MYISQLDRPWLETPFLFQRSELRAPEEMDLLNRRCRYVYIDVEWWTASYANPMRGMSAEEALKRMYEWREKDFHPQLVEEFIGCTGILG